MQNEILSGGGWEMCEVDGRRVGGGWEMCLRWMGEVWCG